MQIFPQEIPEVLVLEPRVFGDERGFFLETYSTRAFPLPVRFVQDNMSFSSKGTLRGLHLQQPNAQGKLVMVATGAIWDVAVDVRVGSPTFGKWVAVDITSDNKRQIYVPPGFAHGFCVVSETAHVIYKCTELYDPKSEVGVRYDDPDLNIPWPVEAPLLSEKDKQASRLCEIEPSRLPVFEGH